MSKEQIQNRLNYLTSELAHSHYHDGWVIQGMKKELDELKEKIKKLDSHT